MAPSPEILERRDCPTVSALSVSVSPQVLRPINPELQPHALTLQHTLPVTIAGEVGTTSETGNYSAPSLSYKVIDSYGRDQPGGPIPFPLSGTAPSMAIKSNSLPPMTSAQGVYGIRIGLDDFRNAGGRKYTIIVTANDARGAVSASTVVTVPPVGFYQHHDRVIKAPTHRRTRAGEFL